MGRLFAHGAHSSRNFLDSSRIRPRHFLFCSQNSLWFFWIVSSPFPLPFLSFSFPRYSLLLWLPNLKTPSLLWNWHSYPSSTHPELSVFSLFHNPQNSDRLVHYVHDKCLFGARKEAENFESFPEQRWFISFVFSNVSPGNKRRSHSRMARYLPLHFSPAQKNFFAVAHFSKVSRCSIRDDGCSESRLLQKETVEPGTPDHSEEGERLRSTWA